MSPLLEYLREDRLPEDPAKAKKLVRDVVKYIIIGTCGTHIGGRALASKIARASYYWPTLKNDCMEYVKKCVEHPQSNGQAEAANKVILKGLRRRLEEAKGRWVKELP
ncbi:hypothetical protein CR513_54488, partial [Mucuna pruriens]